MVSQESTNGKPVMLLLTDIYGQLIILPLGTHLVLRGYAPESGPALTEVVSADGSFIIYARESVQDILRALRPYVSLATPVCLSNLESDHVTEAVR